MSTIDVWILAAADAHVALERLLGGATVTREPDGKPRVSGGPHFNLSHSGDLALVALCADTPIGVDIEAPRRLRNPAGLARRLCSDRELAHLAAAADQDSALLRLWVRKEAVAKAEGSGIALALGGLDVLTPLVRTPGVSFLVHDLAIPVAGYHAAVAWSLGTDAAAVAADAPATRPVAVAADAPRASSDR